MLANFVLKLSIRRQKSDSKKGGYKNTKEAKFLEKQPFLISWYAHVWVHVKEVRNARFEENLTCFVFLLHPFGDSPFCFITDELLLDYYSFTTIYYFILIVSNEGLNHYTKMKLSIKDFYSKCDQMLHLLEKSLIENFIFCAVLCTFIKVSYE